MTRGRSFFSWFVVAACAVTMGGCAADASDESSAPTDSTDALTNAPATAEETPSVATTDEPAGSARVDTGNSRLAAVHDTRAWTEGEPQPIPWNQQKVSADGENDDGTTPSHDRGENPLPPSPSDPAFR